MSRLRTLSQDVDCDSYIVSLGYAALHSITELLIVVLVHQACQEGPCQQVTMACVL